MFSEKFELYEMEFRKLAGKIAWPVSIVFASNFAKDSFSACTINSLTSIHSDKNNNIIAFSLTKKSRTLKKLLETEKFNIYVLNSSGENIAVHFSSQRSTDRNAIIRSENFSGVISQLELASILVLECKVYKVMSLDKSDLILGNVIFGRMLNDEGTLHYRNRQYVTNY